MIFTFSGNKLFRPKITSKDEDRKHNIKNLNKSLIEPNSIKEFTSTRDLFIFGMIGRVQTGITCGHCSR